MIPVGRYSHQPNSPVHCALSLLQTPGPGLVCPKTRVALASGTGPAAPFLLSPSRLPLFLPAPGIHKHHHRVFLCMISPPVAAPGSFCSKCTFPGPSQISRIRNPCDQLQVIPKLTHVQESLRCIHFLTAQPQVLPSQLSRAVYQASSLALMPPGNSTGGRGLLICSLVPRIRQTT